MADRTPIMTSFIFANEDTKSDLPASSFQTTSVLLQTQTSRTISIPSLDAKDIRRGLNDLESRIMGKEDGEIPRTEHVVELNEATSGQCHVHPVLQVRVILIFSSLPDLPTCDGNYCQADRNSLLTSVDVGMCILKTALMGSMRLIPTQRDKTQESALSCLICLMAANL
ncbi:hypothetical protein WG66_001136 [Moniliophthora roreri]|nr:hypothetical protein WG66_001136 [Moniliophthora roreri]